MADCDGTVTDKAYGRRISEAAARALAEAAARRAAERAGDGGATVREAAQEAPEATPEPREIGGRGGPDPVRFGDWEVKGIASDF